MDKKSDEFRFRTICYRSALLAALTMRDGDHEVAKGTLTKIDLEIEEKVKEWKTSKFQNGTNHKEK